MTSPRTSAPPGPDIELGAAAPAARAGNRFTGKWDPTWRLHGGRLIDPTSPAYRWWLLGVTSLAALLASTACR